MSYASDYTDATDIFHTNLVLALGLRKVDFGK